MANGNPYTILSPHVASGLPQDDEFSAEEDPHLIIIDDLMRECIVDIFTKGSHHRNLLFLLLTIYSTRLEVCVIFH